MELKELEETEKKRGATIRRICERYYSKTEKLYNKHPSETLLSLVTLSTNLLFNILIHAEEKGTSPPKEALKEVPLALLRAVEPLRTLKDLFGEVPMKELLDKYEELYEEIQEKEVRE